MIRAMVLAITLLLISAGCRDREMQEDNQGIGMQGDTVVERGEPLEPEPRAPEDAERQESGQGPSPEP